MSGGNDEPEDYRICSFDRRRVRRFRDRLGWIERSQGQEKDGGAATGALIGTPASINASVELQTLAIEVLPFELST